MKSFVAFLWKRRRARETSFPLHFPLPIARYPQRRHSSFYYCRYFSSLRACAAAAGRPTILRKALESLDLNWRREKLTRERWTRSSKGIAKDACIIDDEDARGLRFFYLVTCFSILLRSLDTCKWTKVEFDSDIIWEYELMIKFINLKDKLDRCNWTKKSLEGRIWSRYYLRIGDGIYRLVNNDNITSIDTNE